ncbi:MAG: UDPGP type 1 family protein [Planctomycetes bacterium]|nr:UDPGP type 1 family protein [Planctomycetota bacterium]
MDVNDVFEALRAADQDHVLRFYDQLDADSRRQLEDQVSALDLPLIARLTRDREVACDWAALARRSTPPPAFRLDGRDARFGADEARERGEAALRAGKVAAFLVAGGQGTRLRFPHPKGMFPIGPVSHNCLFQILLERILATARRCRTSIPVFLMTSPATHQETIAFLNEHKRFGLPADDLYVLCQGVMPAVDARTGKLLLSAKDSLALAPDGHGGMLAAFANSGSLARARERGVQQLSYVQIDNPLAQVCQPSLIGYHLLAESEMTSQVIEKRYPLEKVGNVVVVDGKMRIIEYIDLPDDRAHQRHPDGSLVIWAGSIAVHVFDVDFLERLTGQADALPFHRALKKVACIDEQAVPREPMIPNAIKFERFIFDLLPWARNAVVVEGDPSEVFAPVKNADEQSDVDTPNTAHAAIARLHTRWLRDAGAEVRDGVPVEISPLWALDAADVARRVRTPLIVDEPTYFH